MSNVGMGTESREAGVVGLRVCGLLLCVLIGVGEQERERGVRWDDEEEFVDERTDRPPGVGTRMLGSSSDSLSWCLICRDFDLDGPGGRAELAGSPGTQLACDNGSTGWKS